ncbi:MAG: 3-phosphoshikimate 1-carboxyvinyltransferase [Phycisphaerae bacterium]|jgi:3-phosphoshikimate 1-carboxyvinyltransferase
MPIERRGDDVCVHPAPPLDACVTLPGSKSLTNRYLLCCALADGESRLRGASLSDDVQAMMSGLRAFGIAVDVQADAAAMTIRGCRGHLPATSAEIDAGDAGTVMRFLTALAAVGHGRYALDGSARMRDRPIGALVDALAALGAGIGYEGRTGYPPLTVVARGLPGGMARFARPVSSQFVSAVLMVAPYAMRDVLLRVDGGLVSAPYVDMTLRVMRSLGVDALDDGRARFIVPSAQRYGARQVEIEPDASAATYFWAAAAITGGRVLARGLTRDSAQGDVEFVDVLEQMGCRIEARADALGVCGPPDGRLRGVNVDLNSMPDAAQTLAVAALFADGPTEIRNVANLRVKETDRLAALRCELTKLGAEVNLTPDGLRILPPPRVSPAEIDTYNDHRMAMSFALAGLRVPGIVIRGAGCVRKSFPEFFETLVALS